MRSWGNEMVVERFSRKQRVEKKSDLVRDREREKNSFVESLCQEQPEVGNPKPTLQISCEPK